MGSQGSTALERTFDRSAVRKGGLGIADFDALRDIIHDQVGIVLKDNKQALVEARVQKRLRALGMDTFSEYTSFLRRRDSGDEMIQLIDVISTNVTRFFREEEHFRLLTRLTRDWARQGRKRMRFWSAACSSGEEPYSMAMTLCDAVPQGVDMRILATDISTRILDRAVRGIYPRRLIESVPRDLRGRNFEVSTGPEREFCRVVDRVRDMVMFRRLNLKRAPYPIRGEFDIVFLRNAMIYFDQDLREMILAEMRRFIRPGGYLIIGHAETLIGMDNEFVFVRPSVYRRA